MYSSSYSFLRNQFYHWLKEVLINSQFIRSTKQLSFFLFGLDRENPSFSLFVYLRRCQLMNSVPLSEWISLKAKGNLFLTCFKPLNTTSWDLPITASPSHHPELISVVDKVFIYSPRAD